MCIMIYLHTPEELILPEVKPATWMHKNQNFQLSINFSYLNILGCENAKISSYKYFPTLGYLFVVFIIGDHGFCCITLFP